MYCGDKEKFIKWQEAYDGDVNDEFIKTYIKNSTKLSWVTNPRIISYIQNRYSDSYSFEESFRRIIRGDAEVKPLCPICGKPVQYVGRKKKPYTKYCSNKCSSNDKDVQQKRQITDRLRHNGKIPWIESNKDPSKIEHRKQTLKAKYGTCNLYSVKEIQDKIIQTNIERFGAPSAMQNDEIKAKHWESLKSGGNFKGVSKFETLLGEALVKLYGEDDVKTQYSSSQYPFRCDFYIPSKDLYIEYQGSQYHHFHPFNPNDEEDIKELNRLYEKAQQFDRENQYEGMIRIWTISDVEKRKIAKENNLNFIELWENQDLETCLNLINNYV